MKKIQFLLIVFATLLFAVEVKADDFCNPEDQCLITYKLGDAFGDGWTGNSIGVRYADSNGYITWVELGSGRSATGVIPVCPGRTLVLEWHNGTYPEDCSFTFYDVNEDIICEHKAGDPLIDGEVLLEYLVDCSTCVIPTDIETTTTPHEATLSWTGYSDNYNVRYHPVSFYDGFENGLDRWTTVRQAQGDIFTDWNSDQASFFIDSNGNPLEAHNGKYIATSRSWAGMGYVVDNWLITPQVTLGGKLKFWVMDNGIVHDHYDVYISTTTNEIDAFELLYSPGNASEEWAEVTVDLSNYNGQLGYVALRHQDRRKNMIFIDDFGIYLEDEWTVSTTNDATVELTGLDANTSYEYQIQGDCGFMQSKWTKTDFFTTLDECPVPFDMKASTEITAASLSWTGYSEGYNLRYRKAGDVPKYFYEDFEQGIPDDWKNVDNDGDGFKWENYFYEFPIDILGNPFTFGTSCATSYSFNEKGALTPDNWLISPKLALRGTLSVWLRSQDPIDVNEHFAIYLSTWDDNIEHFTTMLVPETTATGVLTEYTADLSNYTGKTGYIAIRHFNSTNHLRLNVDDFALLGEPIDAGEWTTITTDETATVLTGLEPNTTYEYQVQGVCDNKPTEWSASSFFTTTVELLDDDLAMPEGSKNSDMLDRVMGETVDVVFKDRTFYKDGEWNSLCLPFSLTAEQIAASPLAGATIKQYSSGTVTGTHVDISFTTANEIEAGKFYIFKWDEGENIDNPAFSQVRIEKTQPSFVPYFLEYTDDYCFIIGGNFNSIPCYWEDGEVYTYYLGAGNKLRYCDEEFTLHTFRIFFEFYANDVDPGAIEFNLDFDGEQASGIAEFDSPIRSHGIHEGIYTLQGVKVDALHRQKGIYIENGRKVVVK